MSDEILSESALLEALDPESSEDTFKVSGRTVKIKPLKVKYQVQFSRVLEPALGSMAYDFSSCDIVEAILRLSGHYDLIPMLVYVLIKNDLGEEALKLEEFEESDMQPDEMIGVLKRFALKNELIAKPVMDFFSETWPALKAEMQRRVQEVKQSIVSLNTEPTT